MEILTESRDYTPEQLTAFGMVRCCDCLNLQSVDKKGARRCRLAWKPACVPDKWRRCRSFDRRRSAA